MLGHISKRCLGQAPSPSCLQPLLQALSSTPAASGSTSSTAQSHQLHQQPSTSHQHHHQLLQAQDCWSSRRAFSSEASSSSSGDEEDVSKIGNERVQRLAGELLGLNVLEASQLSTILRKRLDIPKPAYGGAAMPAFPMAAMGAAPAAAAPAAAAGAPEAAPEPAKEKTEFDVKLASFSPEGKIKVIKEIRALTSLGLKEAKELVEKAPVVLKSGVTKEDAENWKKVIESAGAKVELA